MSEMRWILVGIICACAFNEIIEKKLRRRACEGEMRRR